MVLTHNDPSHLNLMTEHQPVEVLQLFCMNTVVAPVGVAIPIPVEFGHLRYHPHIKSNSNQFW